MDENIADASVSSSSLPELLPGGLALGEGALAYVVFGPVGGGIAEGVLAYICSVPELVAAACEIPGVASAFVAVVVADGLVDPACAYLDVAMGIDAAGGVVAVGEVYGVGGHLEDGRADFGEALLKALAQGGTA